MCIMPNVGDKTHARDIGGVGKNIYTWLLCPQCEVGRWVYVENLKYAKRRGLCKKCYTQLRGKDSSGWKGGRHKIKGGYIQVKVLPGDFFFPMASKRGYVLEHRLVVAKALGRCLHRWEIVHHKKGYAKDDNRYPETLRLYSVNRHNQMTILEGRITYLEGVICKLTWKIK